MAKKKSKRVTAPIVSNKGRPTMLNVDMIRDAERYLAAGLTIESTCDLLGVSPRSYYNWMKKGRAEIDRVEEDRRRRVRGDHQIYVDFMHTVVRARARAELNALLVIQGAATGKVPKGPDGKPQDPGDWKAAAWFLERSRPKDWGRRKVDIEAKVDTTTTLKFELQEPRPFNAEVLDLDPLTGELLTPTGGDATTLELDSDVEDAEVVYP